MMVWGKNDSVKIRRWLVPVDFAIQVQELANTSLIRRPCICMRSCISPPYHARDDITYLPPVV